MIVNPGNATANPTEIRTEAMTQSLHDFIHLWYFPSLMTQIQRFSALSLNVRCRILNSRCRVAFSACHQTPRMEITATDRECIFDTFIDAFSSFFEKTTSWLVLYCYWFIIGVKWLNNVKTRQYILNLHLALVAE